MDGFLLRYILPTWRGLFVMYLYNSENKFCDFYGNFYFLKIGNIYGHESF